MSVALHVAVNVELPDGVHVVPVVLLHVGHGAGVRRAAVEPRGEVGGGGGGAQQGRGPGPAAHTIIRH